MKYESEKDAVQELTAVAKPQFLVMYLFDAVLYLVMRKAFLNIDRSKNS